MTIPHWQNNEQSTFNFSPGALQRYNSSIGSAYKGPLYYQKENGYFRYTEDLYSGYSSQPYLKVYNSGEFLLNTTKAVTFHYYPNASASTVLGK